MPDTKCYSYVNLFNPLNHIWYCSNSYYFPCFINETGRHRLICPQGHLLVSGIWTPVIQFILADAHWACFGVQGTEKRAKLEQMAPRLPGLPGIQAPFEMFLFKNYSDCTFFPVWLLCTKRLEGLNSPVSHHCQGTHLSAGLLMYLVPKVRQKMFDTSVRAPEDGEISSQLEEWGRFPAVSSIWAGFNRWGFSHLDLGENHEESSLEWSVHGGIRRSSGQRFSKTRVWSRSSCDVPGE